MSAVFFAMLIVYLILRYYVPMDKIVGKLLGKQSNASDPQEGTSPIVSIEKPCFIKSFLIAIFFTLPFFLLLFVVQTWWHAMIFIGVVFIINLSTNMIVSGMRAKCKIIYGVIYDLVIHLSAMYIFYILTPFKADVSIYSQFWELIALLLFIGKPCSVIVNELNFELFGYSIETLSLESILGVLLRIVIVLLIDFRQFLAIPFLLAVIVALRFKDLQDETSRNRVIFEILANFALPFLINAVFIIC